MNDDFNSPVLIAHLFDGVRFINSVNDTGNETVTQADLLELKKLYSEMLFDVLGLKNDLPSSDSGDLAVELMNAILSIRMDVRARKDFATSDLIRDELKKVNVVIKDGKDGTSWERSK